MELLTTKHTEMMIQGQNVAPPRVHDSLIDQTPIHVLSRKRLIRTIEIAAETDTADYVQFDPLQVLCGDPNMVAYMTNFKAFTADIRIEVVMTSASTTYGMVQVSWVYGKHSNFKGRSTTPILERRQTIATYCTSPETYLLDVSSSEGVEFVIPYRYPRNYIEFPSSEGYASMIVANRGTHAAVGGTAFPRMQVFASLENVKAHLVARGDILNEQADRQVILGNMAGIGSIGTIIAWQAATDSFTKTMKNFLTVTDDVAERAGTMYQNIPSIPRPSMPTMPTLFTQDTTASHTPVKQGVWGDVATTQYSSSTNVLDVTHPTQIVQIPNAIMPSLEDLVGIPSIVQTFSLSSATAEGTQYSYKVNLRQSTTQANNTWANYYGRCFRYVRYDTRLIYHFKMTSLSSYRVKITVNYGTDVTDSYDVPGEIHLIKGSVDVPIDIPFVNINPCVTPDATLATVTVTLLSSPLKMAAQDILSPVFVSSSVHNAQFFSPQKFLHRNPVTPLVEQGSLRAMHQIAPGTAFVSPGKEACHMTPVTSLDTLLRRYSEDVGFLLDPVIIYPDSILWYLNSPQYQILAAPFAFYTGSKEVKIKSLELSEADYWGLELVNGQDVTNVSMGNGRAQTEVTIWPVVDALIPYLSNLPFLSFQSDSDALVYPAQPVGFVPTPLSAVMFSRAGPDFQVSYPNALPPQSLWG